MVLTCITVYMVALVPNNTAATPSIYFEPKPSAKPLFTQTYITHSILFAKLSGVLNGNTPAQSRRGGITNLGPSFIAGDKASVRLFHNTNIDITGPPENLAVAVQIDGTRYVHTYGLLSGCIIRYHTLVKPTPLPGKALVPVNTINQELNRITGPASPQFTGLRQTSTKLNPLLLILDCVFLVLFLLWLISAALIPTWSMWSGLKGLLPKRPMPKIEIVRNCPSCLYPTTGLTSNTCPECGTALPSPREA